MSEYDNQPYEVSFIASAPEEFKVGDRVEVVDEKDDLYKQQGCVTSILMDGGINVDFLSVGHVIYEPKQLYKLPSTSPLYAEKFHSARSEKDSDNVKAFKAILNEMAETYRAKDATYGNAYQDGFNRFGAVQLVSRMYEKYCRIENLLVRNADNKVFDESVIDTITDLGVQCVVLRMLLQKNDFENVD